MMLKGIPPEITPELLAEIAQLGHGDRVAVVDRNFPAYSRGASVVVLAGVDVTEALEALWVLLPIDAFVEEPVEVMTQDSGEPSVIHDSVGQLATLAERRSVQPGRVDRHGFYEGASECQLIVKTSDSRPYACAMFSVGVV